MTYLEACCAALVLVAVGAGTATAQDGGTEDLRRELDQLRETVERQQERIDELERGKAADRGALDEAVRLYLDELGQDDGLSFDMRTKRGAQLELYGFVRLDMMRDDSRPQDTQVIGWVRSEDPAAAPPTGAREGSEDFTVSARLTRLGLNLNGGSSGALGAETTGKVEIDFYEGGSDSRARLRMRHAYVKLRWDDVSVLAGQTYDLISPLYTAVNHDLAMWGAGNLGDRRPQLRIEYAPRVGDATYFLQGMLGVTGGNAQEDLDANGYLDGEESGKPTLQGRAAVRLPLEGGNFEVGVWGHQASEDPAGVVGGSDDFESRALGFDLTLPIAEDWLWLKSEWWTGRNLDDVRGGIFQGVNTATGQEIDAKGGWVELGVRPSEWATLHFGYSVDNPTDGHLGVGGRGKNRIYYAAARMTFDDVSLGIEYLNWTTKYVGFGDGTNNRVGAFVAYNF